jgi:hypothetical protein
MVLWTSEHKTQNLITSTAPEPRAEQVRNRTECVVPDLEFKNFSAIPSSFVLEIHAQLSHIIPPFISLPSAIIACKKILLVAWVIVTLPR